MNDETFIWGSAYAAAFQATYAEIDAPTFEAARELAHEEAVKAANDAAKAWLEGT